MNKLLSAFALTVIFATTLLSTPLNASGIDSGKVLTKGKVEIQVIYGNITDDEISEIELEDGTFINSETVAITRDYNTRAYSTLGDFFHSVVWVNNKDGKTLSLNPKSNVRTNKTAANNGWAALSNTSYGVGFNSYFYKNKGALNDQYYCHYNYAKTKDRWNLDTWRPDVSYAATVATGCNP